MARTGNLHRPEDAFPVADMRRGGHACGGGGTLNRLFPPPDWRKSKCARSNFRINPHRITSSGRSSRLHFSRQAAPCEYRNEVIVA